MPKLHVLPKREDLNAARLREQGTIVLGILFVTTIAHAFEDGATDVGIADDRGGGLRMVKEMAA